MKMTIGQMIDALSVVNIRIWMAEDIKRNPGATDKEIADATKITNIVNSQRNDLIENLDQALNELSEGKKQKTYKQGTTKIYGKR